MEVIVKEYLYEKIISLIEEGYSLYEIAHLLNAHSKLILKTIGKSGALLKLESNNRNFILEINANYPSPLMADIEFRKYNIITGAKGKVVFTVKYPDTLTSWKEKLSPLLKAELAERNENRATISEYETRVESVSEKTDEGELALPLPELEKIEKQIISDYLDGVTIHTLSLRHKVREISLRKLIEDHDLPLKITRNMLIERIKIIYKNGASRQEIERRFAHLGERQVVLMLKQKSKPHDKKEFVKEDALPEKEKKKIEFTEDIIKAIIEEYKTGAPPDEIAKNRMVKLSHVLKLLRASRCYKSYYQKEIKNLTVRDAAIVDYYKRGWNLLELKSEFNTSAWKIQRVLDKNKLKPEDENPFSEKRTKADLAVNYFKKGKSIFDIAELLEMTAERVEYLLRKKGVLEEEDFI